MRDRDGTAGSRLRAGAATLLIHAALLPLLLRTGIVPPIAIDQRALTIFDLRAPDIPPPLPPEIATKPTPERVQPRPVDHPAAAGGAPPAAPIPRPSIDQAAPATMNVSLAPDTLPATLPATADAAMAQGGDPGRGATGTGSGAGEGSGDRLDGGAPQRFQRADWIKYPTDAVINRYWPAEAIQRRLSGEVILACAISRPGQPDRCIALYEAPRGVGFAAAALRLSRTFRIRPSRINDRDAPDVPVLIPVTFKARR